MTKQSRLVKAKRNAAVEPLSCVSFAMGTLVKIANLKNE